MSLWLTKPLPEALQREVNIERLLRLSGHRPIAAIAFSINTLIVIAAIWDRNNAYALLGWLAVFQAISILQFRGWLRNRDKPRPAFVPPKTIARSVGHAVFLGALLGAFGATNFPAEAHGQQMIVSFIIIGSAGASVVALYPVPAAAFSFILLSILPVMAAALSLGEAVYTYVAVLAFVYIAVLLFSVRRAYLSFIDAMERRLENQKLAEKAQAANRAKSMFLAKMSHELRTPLNAIIGFSDIIENEMFGPIGVPQYADYLRNINKSGCHLLTLVDNILDASTIDAGGFELDEEDVEIAQIVESFLAHFAEAAREAELELSADIAEPAPRIRADRRRLEQILSNLLANAIKFTPAGGSVRIAAGLDTARGLDLAVSDTGAGIAGDDMARIQAAFGMTGMPPSANGDTDDSHIAREGEGAILGLTLARALTEAHGGTLSIDSTVGSGTTVRMTFPAARTLELPGEISYAI